jgi:hypothetical protein
MESSLIQNCHTSFGAANKVIGYTIPDFRQTVSHAITAKSFLKHAKLRQLQRRLRRRLLQLCGNR